MPSPQIADVIRIQGRFLRSANLQRDFRDPVALDGYVITDSARSHLRRMIQGLAVNSGRRSWRITGDYGSGKSSFALLVAHCFAGKDSPLPPKIRRVLDVDVPRQINFLPVLITGSREPIAVAVLRSLAETLERRLATGRKIGPLLKIKELLHKPSAQIQDNEVLELIVETNSHLIASGHSTGMLIILDELGKFLEYAALHPERQDVFFLQQLGEISARSGSQPLFTIGLLHQGFSSYADHLSQSAQREWEKIGGRFEELLFAQPLEQVSHLLAAALDVSEADLPRGLVARAKTAMRAAISLGWYGTAAPITALTGIAADIYPLNPSVVPVLVKFFSKFGQNERSLFSFLLSTEPYGLQEFAQQEATADSTYRVHHLFDYAAANFGNRLSFQTYRNHWNHIESLVRSFPASDETEVAVLKTVGLLNLLNVPDLVATEDAITLAICDPGSPVEVAVRKTIQRLCKDRHVLYQRGRSGSYFLWSHTSVNLEAAYEEAGRAVAHQKSVAQRVKDYLDNRPIVARRHYIQTGNLRHFDIQYCSLPELESLASSELERSDGRIIVPLVETPEQAALALQFATSFKNRSDTLIGITEPLGSLSGLMMEADRWNWVQKHTPELKDDRYAAEEVARQMALASQTLEKRIRHFVGLGQSAQSGESSIRWFFQGKEQTFPDSKSFISYLSELCDNLYCEAPLIHNEIVNRRTLSSAAASARMRLIERMFSHADCALLGMDRDKRPPEMSIYLSLLKRAQLHVEKGGRWKLQEPLANNDPCRLRPALETILEILRVTPDQRIELTVVMDELRRAPFGIRDGVLPILLVLTLLEHPHEIALYEKGTFLSQVGKEEILRLTKAPQLFELQLCEVRGLRRDLFDRISEMLDLGQGAKKADILAVIRPLCVFAAELPEYSRQTKNLPSTTLAVRDVLLSAREPGTMLFRELPEALGLEAFASSDLIKAGSLRVQEYVKCLRKALDNLKMALPQLKNRIRDQLGAAFELSSSEDFQAFRDALSSRSQNVLVQVSDMGLKAFCLRLFDNNLSEPDWIESVGSLVATTPPSRWKDSDEETFAEKLAPLVRKFLNAESVLFSSARHPQPHATFKVELTNRDGTSKHCVVHLAPTERQAVTELEKAISNLLAKHKTSVGLEALSRNVWQLLKDDA